VKYDPSKHHRRSIRLRGYDYGQVGAYFVTICTQDRLCLFGDVENGEMRLNDVGSMVQGWWLALPGRFQGLAIDVFVTMPNHFHGIVALEEGGHVGPPLHHRGGTPAPVGADQRVRPPAANPRISLKTAIQWFKTMTTNEYIRAVKQRGWPSFPGRLWQRNYYDHIIRNERSVQQIREYIATNPAMWQLDQLHPDNPSKW
jgi:REP-associated tyrosine transposase